MKMSATHEFEIQVSGKECHDYLCKVESYLVWEDSNYADPDCLKEIEGDTLYIRSKVIGNLTVEYLKDKETAKDLFFRVKLEGFIKGTASYHFQLNDLEGQRCRVRLYSEGDLRLPWFLPENLFNRIISREMNVIACNLALPLEQLRIANPIQKEFLLSDMPACYYLGTEISGLKTELWQKAASSYVLLYSQLNSHEATVTGITTVWPKPKRAKEQGAMRLCLEVGGIEPSLAKQRAYQYRPALKCLTTQMLLASCDIPVILEKLFSLHV